jgi:hypothetical protein
MLFQTLFLLAVVVSCLNITQPQQGVTLSLANPIEIAWTANSTDPQTIDLEMGGGPGVSAIWLATNVSVAKGQYNVLANSINITEPGDYMFSIIAYVVENARNTLVAESESFCLQSPADRTSTGSGMMPSSMNVAGDKPVARCLYDDGSRRYSGIDDIAVTSTLRSIPISTNFQSAGPTT